MQDTNYITVRKSDIVMRRCQACATTTAHIGKEGLTCLQCTVDGAMPPDLKKYNRWIAEDGSIIQYPNSPRGYRSK